LRLTPAVETVEKPFARKNYEKISHFRLKNDQNYTCWNQKQGNFQ